MQVSPSMGHQRITDLDAPMTQQEFGAIVGITQPTVSRLASNGVLDQADTGGEWLRAYIHRLREQAAGRMSGEIGGLDLVQERAALAREQRKTYALKNAVAEGKFAPIGLLTAVLATASQCVVDCIDLLPGQLRNGAPDLPDAARKHVEAVIADARNEWIRQTAELTPQPLEDQAAEPEQPGEPEDAFGPPDEAG